MTATRAGMPACPAWCVLPEGHADPTSDEFDGAHFRTHETAPVGLLDAVTIEQGEAIDPQGIVDRRPAGIYVHTRSSDPEVLDASQARLLAAALLDASDMLDRIKAGAA